MKTATGRQVALLRGINVGKAKRVAMADLRALVGRALGDAVTTRNWATLTKLYALTAER